VRRKGDGEKDDEAEGREERGRGVEGIKKRSKGGQVKEREGERKKEKRVGKLSGQSLHLCISLHVPVGLNVTTGLVHRRTDDSFAPTASPRLHSISLGNENCYFRKKKVLDDVTQALFISPPLVVAFLVFFIVRIVAIIAI
jgi:hypothetical protein